MIFSVSLKQMLSRLPPGENLKKSSGRTLGEIPSEIADGHPRNIPEGTVRETPARPALGISEVTASGTPKSPAVITSNSFEKIQELLLQFLDRL